MTKTIEKLMSDDVTTLFVTDGEGNILLANEFTAMTLGMALGELLNSNVYDLVAKEIYNASATIETLKTHQPSQVKLTTKAGYHIHSKANPLFYPDGTLHLVVTKSDPLTEEEMQQWSEEVQPHQSQSHFDQKSTGVIAESIEMKRILRICKQVSQYNSRILLLGESGVGKEVVANYIHQQSPLAENTFVAVNCAAIPESLFESEFFGYEKGTFTGAKESKMGLIEAANGGTLFLDEISEMPLELQAKLLRALETMKIRRVGSLEELPVSFRLISASNQDILSLVEEGKFRRDLYYRINAIPVQIPPLRKRKKDIVALAHHFLDGFNQRYQTEVSLSAKQIKYLLTNQWSGNIRELKNYIEYIVVTAELALPEIVETPEGDFGSLEGNLLQLMEETTNYHTFMATIEKVYFKQLLDENHWNISQTAEKSGISRPLLYKKIAELSLEQSDTIES